MIIKTMKKIVNTVLVFSVFLINYGKAYAAPPRFEQIGGVLDGAFKYILPIGGLLALGMLVYGGYMWLISQGDPGRIKQAQGTITWAVLGLIFLYIFALILREIFDFIGN